MTITSPAVVIVNDKYQKSVLIAEAAKKSVASFQQALNASIYQPPQISVQWSTMAAPTLPSIPNAPPIPAIEFRSPAGKPGAFSASLGSTVIDPFTELPPALNFTAPPQMNIGAAPPVPEPRDIALPAAPTIDFPVTPTFLTVGSHSFAGITSHDGWLSRLNDVPTLSILQPERFNYSPGARYASQLLDTLKATLQGRLAGGTGLPAHVEQQLWDRARDRETQLALAREQEVLRSAEALGFPLPSGVLAGQLADARREYHDKLAGLSRDISIKQAELEQQNLKDSIDSALAVESALLDNSYKLEMLAFEASKAAAENAIAAHNAALEHFKTLVDRYKVFASVYDTLVRAELSKVEVFKALLAGEQTKADINKSLVDRYKVEIDARMARVEIYKAQMSAAQTMTQLEQTRIQAAAERVRGFVATVNAETAKFEAYKARTSGEAAKAEGYRALAQAYSAKAGAQAEKARVEIARYQAQLSAKTMEWEGWKAEVMGETARVEAEARKASVLVDGYKVGAVAAEAQAQSVMRRWEADIKQYEAGRTLTMETAKANAASTMHANDARMEAAKVGLATAAQQLASAWAMVSASAQMQDSTQTSYKGGDLGG